VSIVHSQVSSLLTFSLGLDDDGVAPDAVNAVN